MNRILATAAAALIAAPAFAQGTGDMNQEDQMTMLRDNLRNTLAECNVEMTEEEIDQLTLAQISGIVLAGSSEDGGELCERVESIAM